MYRTSVLETIKEIKENLKYERHDMLTNWKTKHSEVVSSPKIIS